VLCQRRQHSPDSNPGKFSVHEERLRGDCSIQFLATSIYECMRTRASSLLLSMSVCVPAPLRYFSSPSRPCAPAPVARRALLGASSPGGRVLQDTRGNPGGKLIYLKQVYFNTLFWMEHEYADIYSEIHITICVQLVSSQHNLSKKKV
jgi:hypothetical protein